MKKINILVLSMITASLSAYGAYTFTQVTNEITWATATSVLVPDGSPVLTKKSADYTTNNAELVGTIALVVTNDTPAGFTDWTVTSDPPMPAEWTYDLFFVEASEEEGAPATGWVVEIYNGGTHVGEGLWSGDAESTSVTWSTADEPGTFSFLVIDDDYTNVWNSGSLTITRQYNEGGNALGLATVSNLNASAAELRREMQEVIPGSITNGFATTEYVNNSIANADTTYRQYGSIYQTTNLNQSIQFIAIPRGPSPVTELKIEIPPGEGTKDWIVYVDSWYELKIDLPTNVTWLVADKTYTNSIPANQPTALYFSQAWTNIFTMGRQYLQPVRFQ